MSDTEKLIMAEAMAQIANSGRPPTVKEQPILFSGEMVSRILAGRKTQTRRIIKNLRITGPNPPDTFDVYRADTWIGAFGRDGHGNATALCPYGAPGDRLWVRETFNVGWLDGGKILYRAGAGSAKDAGFPSEPKWKPAIHMSRSASRLTLEIIDVRVERVQDISEQDCISEGVQPPRPGVNPPGKYDVLEAFSCLWDSINEARGFGWDVNPFVWVISFRRLNADQL